METGSNNPRLERLLRNLAVAVALVALLFHLVAIRREPAQLDEFEHLHAAWMVANGNTPYVDFFEHHTPLFYFAAAPFLKGANPSYDTVLNMRLLALCFTVFASAVGWLWLRRSFGPMHGLLAVCLFAANTTILSLGHTTFLDTYSAPFLVASAMLFAGGRRRPAWMLASGLCFGFAVLFNLKASMAVFAPIAISLSRLWGARSNWTSFREWLADNLSYLAGGLASIAIVTALLGIRGTVGMWQYTVVLNLGWKARHSGFPFFGGVLWRESFVTFAVAAFALFRLATLPRRNFELEERDTPWLFFASITGGLFILPVVWSEYFAQMAPFMALSAAVALGDWMSLWSAGATATTGVFGRASAFANSIPGRVSFFFLALFGNLAIFPYRAFFREDQLALVQSALIIVALLAFHYWLGREPASCPERMRVHAAVCLALITVVPLTRVGTTLHRAENGEQRADVEYLMANTSASDAVFDGYTGYGVFRPHAYFYWFLHQEVQAMLPEADKSDRLLQALESNRPRMIIADHWVADLPARVRDYLAERYEPSSHSELLQRRKPEGADATTASLTGVPAAKLP